MSTITPMTAAEYRGTFVGMSPLTRRILAALEDRERLLAERLGPPDHCYWCKQPTFGVDMAAHSRQCDKHPLSADAAVGALVRHLVETTGAQWNPAYIVKVGTGISYPLTREGLQSALDSLLPKEPEVVAGLPMETKVALTCQLLGDGDLRLSVLTPRERAVMKLGEATLALHAASDEQFGAALAKRDLAVIEAIRALPPSPAPMEGRSNE